MLDSLKPCDRAVLCFPEPGGLCSISFGPAVSSVLGDEPGGHKSVLPPLSTWCFLQG